jgi:hypothetical protein
MGVVYKARQLSLDRTVALKMILPGGPASEELVQRFHREAKSAAALDHPNIVAIYDHGQQDGRHFFTMAYVEGASLRDIVRRDGVPPHPQVVEWMRGVIEAVAMAHAHNIIHRDLKPENVLIDKQGRPRVTDFGLAKRTEGDPALTGAGDVLGTPAYMAPEQALGKEVGPTADIYGLGGILYFLLTGRAPFQGPSVTAVLYQVVSERPVPPQRVNAQVPSELEVVCLRCLEKDPANRYPSAEALLAALRDAAARTDTLAGPSPLDAATLQPPGRAGAPNISKPMSGGPTLVMPAKPSRARWIGMAVAAAVLVAGGLWVALNGLPWGGEKQPSQSSGGGELAKKETAAKAVVQLTKPGSSGPDVTKNPPELPAELRKDFGLQVQMVGLQPDESGVYRLKKDANLKFRVKVDQDAYVGIWTVEADGTIIQLFPNANEKEHRFRKNEVRDVPESGVDTVTSKGLDYVWVQASTAPWDSVEGERAGPYALFRSIRERETLQKLHRGMRLPGNNLSEKVLKYQVGQ